MSRFATKITDGLFSQPAQLTGLRLPSRDALIGEYMMGVSEAETIKNRADLSNPLVVQGTGHVYNAATVTLKSSLTVGYGYTTNYMPDEHSTLIIVRKRGTISTNTFFAGMATPAAWGFLNFGTASHFHGFDPAANGGAVYAVPPAAGILFFQAGVSNILNQQLGTGGKATHYWYESGVQTSIQTPTATALASVRRLMSNATNRFAIGSNTLSDSGTSTTFEVAFVAVYQRPLTAAEIETAYRAIVAYYATRGVTVV
jgi:hypothetical protein